MSKTFYQYLEEKAMEFYDNPKVVQKVTDTSDKTRGAEDYTYSNSDMQSFYSRGNGFVTDDRSEYYEAIKAIKDLTDKHLFLRNMVWKVDNDGRKIVFSFVVTKLESDEATDFFLHGVQQHLILNLTKKLGNIYDMDSKFSKDNEDNKILKIILTRNENTRKRLELVQAGNPNADIMNPRASSVSRI